MITSEGGVSRVYLSMQQNSIPSTASRLKKMLKGSEIFRSNVGRRGIRMMAVQLMMPAELLAIALTCEGKD